jgi:hypothetical protein
MPSSRGAKVHPSDSACCGAGYYFIATTQYSCKLPTKEGAEAMEEAYLIQPNEKIGESKVSQKITFLAYVTFLEFF